MLALLDHCVSELHGTYVMEDTDSMAIVATEHGALVPCPGGPFEMADGHAAVRAVPWKEVDEIAERLAKLSPYADKSRSILKIERDNYDPETGKQRQVYCLAISPNGMRFSCSISTAILSFSRKESTITKTAGPSTGSVTSETR
jgi:hypothetical protein